MPFLRFLKSPVSPETRKTREQQDERDGAEEFDQGRILSEPLCHVDAVAKFQQDRWDQKYSWASELPSPGHHPILIRSWPWNKLCNVL